jgi:hypothetical protein
MTETEAELRELLARAEMVDLERVTATLDRWPRPARLADTLSVARSSNDPATRRALEDAIARALLRDASGEVAHAARRLVGRTSRPDLHAAVTRTAKRLGVRAPAAGTLAGRLGALTSSFVDRTLLTMSAAEQQRLVGEGVDRTAGHRRGASQVARAAALPALHATIGTAALLRVAEAIVAQTTAALLGRELARAATRAVLARAPFVTAALGPAAWAASAAMLIYEVQRPADRKLTPALLCLGLVALR